MQANSSTGSQPYPYISVFRDDYQIKSARDRTIFYSYYTNHMSRHPELCVLYLHANNGSRVEGLHYLEHLLKNYYNVCLIDFCGSGWSEGQYVTLGREESGDLEAVCAHMQATKGVNKVVLWGRSMGACTAIMYASKNGGICRKRSNVVGMILDSPFKNLRKLVK